MTGIASPIEWETVQGAILAWLVDSTGLTVAWAEQPKRTQSRRPAATLKLLSGPRVIHNDHTTKTWNAETELIDRVASGLREFTVTANVYTDDVKPNGHAINYLARAQAALKMPEFLKALSTAGVAVVTHEGINNLTAIAGADWESRASMDVVFRVASNVVAGSIVQIANTTHSLTLKNGNDGQPIIVPAP
jgi:hypothetical protein